MAIFDPDAGGSIYYDDVLQIATQDPDANAQVSGLSLRHDNATSYDAGWAVMPKRATDITGNTTLASSDFHTLVPISGGSAKDLTLPNTAAAGLVGGVIWIINRGSVSATISVATAANLDWYDGSGSVQTGDRTLAVGGWATAWQETQGNWLLTGTGLT